MLAVGALVAAAASSCGAPSESAGAPVAPRAAASVTDSAIDCRETLEEMSSTRLAALVSTISVQMNHLASVRSAVRGGVGALLLFGGDAPANLAEQLRSLEAAAPAGLRPLVMTDEEGGGIQRVAKLVGSMPWPRTAARTESASQVRRSAKQVAGRMATNAITVNLAPVLDLSTGRGPDAHHPDGRRSFSGKAQVASRYGLAFARGMSSGGVTPVVKHFPGLGTANNNTDSGPARTKPLTYLKRHDLRPFEAAIAAGLPAVMTSNAVVPGLGREPVSLSRRAVTGLLVKQLGFHGLVVTDGLTAGAIRAAGDGPAAAAVTAIRAGADLVLDGNHNNQRRNLQVWRATVAALQRAVVNGRLSLRRLRAAGQQVLAVGRLDGCAS